MNNQAFDEALRRIVADAEPPYDPDAWTRVAQRLDAHQTGRKKRVILPFSGLRWPVAAAVVALALAAGWWLHDATDNKKVLPMIMVASTSEQGREVVGSRHHTHTPTIPVEPTAEEMSVPLPADASRSTHVVSAHPPKHTDRNNSAEQSFPPTNKDVARAGMPVAAPIQTTPSSEPELSHPVRPNEILQSPPLPKPKPQIFAGDFPSVPAPKAARSTSFDVAGGYGFSNTLSAFAVGVAVKRTVGSRLRVEGGLAFVGGAQATQVTVTEQVAFSPSPGPGISPSGVSSTTDSSYSASATARGLYLQASPSVSYRVYKGFSAGGGVDAQRLLGSPSTAKSADMYVLNTNNMFSVSTPAQPDWDFGFTLRADYELSRAMRIGIQHRESLRATADGERAAGRSYWLLQAGFRLR